MLPNEIARRDLRGIHFADEPLPVYLGPIAVSCDDQHDLRVALQLRVAIRVESVDRRAFTDLLMRQREVATTQDVASYLSPFLRGVVQDECASPAATLVAEAYRAGFLDRLRKALDAAAFDAGLIVLPPFRLEVSSPSLQAERQVQAERARAVQRADEQLAQVRHASDVMKEFASLRNAAPEARASSLLERIAPADRSSVLLATLAAGAAESAVETVVAVAGDSLLILGTDATQPKASTLPNSLGPLRSLRTCTIGGRQRLLIGARCGVWLTDPSNPTDSVAYQNRASQSMLGFNAAAIDGEILYATHADAGLVSWHLDNGDTPIAVAARVESAAGARQLQALGEGGVLFTVGNALEILQNGESFRVTGNSTHPIIAIINDGKEPLIVHADGVVSRFESSTRQLRMVATVSGSLSGAALLPWIGGSRLLVARDAGGIECIGLEDSVVHRYRSPYSGAVRAIAAGSAIVVALTNDRQRLMTWNPGEARDPNRDFHISSLVHHRLADVAVIQAAALTA